MARLSHLSDEAFYVYTKKIKEFVEEHGAKYGVDMGWFTGSYVPAFKEFETAHENNRDRATRSHMTAEMKKIARDEFTPLVSRMVLILKGLPSMTGLDLAALNIATGTGGDGRPSGRPELSPLIEADTSCSTQVMLLIFDSKTKKRRKPKGVTACLLAIGLLGADPDDFDSDMYRLDKRVIDPELLPFRTFVTKGKLLMQFKAHQSGLKLMVAASWLNSSGERGPWAKIMVVVIP
jgi:hypothetical protein